MNEASELSKKAIGFASSIGSAILFSGMVLIVASSKSSLGIALSVAGVRTAPGIIELTLT
jgi:hypothetical protein